MVVSGVVVGTVVDSEVVVFVVVEPGEPEEFDVDDPPEGGIVMDGTDGVVGAGVVLPDGPNGSSGDSNGVSGVEVGVGVIGAGLGLGVAVGVTVEPGFGFLFQQ